MFIIAVGVIIIIFIVCFKPKITTIEESLLIKLTAKFIFAMNYCFLNSITANTIQCMTKTSVNSGYFYMYRL